MMRADAQCRPILMSGPMVISTLNDRKSQTRRVAHLNCAGRLEKRGRQWHPDDPAAVNACPYGAPGDFLYVRENWARYKIDQDRYDIAYRATPPNDWPADGRWRPSIHMPRIISRITLQLTDVRVERLNGISEADAIAEGISNDPKTGLLWLPCEEKGKAHISPVRAYRCLWESLNGAGSWDANPLVWVIQFRRVESAKAAA